MMKLRNFFFVLAVTVFGSSLVSCSDDDGENRFNAPFEIELTVQTNATYRGTELEIFGSEITVDWGDGSDLNTYLSSSGLSWSKFEHQYPVSTGTKEYTVKINGKGLFDFRIKPDPANSNVLASIVKFVDFKQCPTLHSVELLGVEDMESSDINHAKLPELEQLILNATTFTAIDYTSFAKFRLKSIILQNNQLLSNIKLPADTKTISIDNCPLLTSNAVNYKNYKELEVVYLNSCNWTSLDLQSNLKLTNLVIYNSDIETINISKQSKLENLYVTDSSLKEFLLGTNIYEELDYIYLENNQIEKEEFNALFNRLPSVTREEAYDYILYIYGNPGTDSCNKEIAEGKGWRVQTTPW
ncbi:hypothetical protein [Dysgonomonas sp. 25]|uniref:hypothetical protein n=1 Tax=Dysgonomonas sp. 25 TaxID=2302933 RepID=UPI0013D3A04A|nr:hypothetical protein [Dysgonomonas sp. 25]